MTRMESSLAAALLSPPLAKKRPRANSGANKRTVIFAAALFSLSLFDQVFVLRRDKQGAWREKPQMHHFNSNNGNSYNSNGIISNRISSSSSVSAITIAPHKSPLNISDSSPSTDPSAMGGDVVVDDELSPNNNRTRYYTWSRIDRAGMALTTMLGAHAYAFANNGTYAGACARRPDDGLNPQREAFHRQLVRDLGLQNLLPFACPPIVESSSINREHHPPYILFDEKDLSFVHKQYQTEDWLRFIRSHAAASLESHETNPVTSDSTIFRVAVHLRRGDVTPCNKWRHRYLPNSHYLRVLDDFVHAATAKANTEGQNRTIQVSIFSETKSPESWDAFIRRNYTMMLDTDIAETWRHMMTADMLITGWSSFSLFPATFNPNQVIFTPFNRGPLKEWTVLNQTYLDRIEKDKAQLQCPDGASQQRNRSL